MYVFYTRCDGVLSAASRTVLPRRSKGLCPRGIVAAPRMKYLTYSVVEIVSGVKIDDVKVGDRLRELTQQEDDDDYDEHHLQLHKQVYQRRYESRHSPKPKLH